MTFTTARRAFSAIVPAIALAAFSAPAFAQQWVVFQGEIQNKDTSGGKCTVEVRVDGTVEIEIYGTTGRMRTLDGQPGQWRRMDCNIPLPADPTQFDLSPQDGRGRQTLVRNPRDTPGAALIRVEDPNGGAANYKFDIEWRGGSAPPANPENNIFSGVFGGQQTNDSGVVGGARRGGAPVVANGGVAGWNSQVNSQDNGQGYFRPFNRADDQLTRATVQVDRNGSVRASFDTNQRGRVDFTGNLVLADGNRLIANVMVNRTPAVMEIQLDNRNRAQEIAVIGTGNGRYELRWQMR